MISLKRQAISGIKWSATSNATVALVNLIKVSVLTRFLEKSDFGLMALVTFVIGFTNLFMDMGLSSAILHKQDISREEYSSLYWFNVIFSLLLFGLISILSPLVASFYKEPQLSFLIPLMAFGIILTAIGRQYKTIEQKKLNFRYLAITEIIGAVTGLITGIVLAVLGFGVFSLVIGTLARFAVSNMIFFVKGLRAEGLLMHFRFKETLPFVRMGIYQVGGQAVNYFNRDLDVLLIGKLFGSDILGGYSLAKELVRRPMGIINPVYTRVGMSVFPKFQSDHASLRRHFLNLFNGMGVLNAFIYGSMAILAPVIVLILYGHDYVSIALYVQLFAIVIYFRSLGTNVGILVITTGRTDYEFYWNILLTLIMPAIILAGAQHSAQLIIILLGLAQIVLLVPGWYIFYKRLINMPFYSFMKPNIVPFLIAGSLFILSQHFFGGNLFWEILVCIILLVFLAVYSYFNIKEIKDVVNQKILIYLKKLSKLLYQSDRNL